MKKLLCLMMTLALCAGTGCARNEDAAAQNAPQQSFPVSSPSAVVAGFIDSLRDFDIQKAGDYVTGDGMDAYIGNEYVEILRGVLSRLQYRITDERIDGDTALVEVEVTAVDLTKIAKSMLVDLAKEAALQKIKGSNVDIAAFLKDYFSNKVDPKTLSTVKTNATVHLIKDAGGKWRVDLDNQENLDFVNALTGGFVETLQSVRDFLSDYGIV